MKRKLLKNILSVKFFNKRSYRIGTALGTATMATMFFFQNCSQAGSIHISGNAPSSESALNTPSNPESPNDGPTGGGNPTTQPPVVINPPSNPGGVCMGVSCDLTPLTVKPAVTTILLALGDAANDELVINGASSQLIAETVIRYTSPKSNPKILIVQDSDIAGEDPEDTKYVADVLLKRYDTHLIVASEDGLSEEDVAGYDLVWFNNPGYPMKSVKSRDTLLAFKGGVVLQGDDMSRGVDFSLESLTRLKYIDNSTSIVCDGQSYDHNDNGGYQFKVSLVESLFPGTEAVDNYVFRYGNDIDEVEVLEGVEVLATAVGGHESCTQQRPAITRYFKDSYTIMVSGDNSTASSQDSSSASP